MSDLQVFPISIPGGIEQSKPEPDEMDLEELENFGIFRNRIGLRPPMSVVATLLDAHATTPVEVDAILDIVEHGGKMWIASWSSTEQDVYLSSMQVDGTLINSGFPLDPKPLTIHTGVAVKPTISLTSFAGGDANTGVDRLYVTDYNQNLPTKYVEGTTVNTLTADLDASGAAEDVYFSLMIPFKFHLWGTGFFEGTTERPEMLRFSQPGLIPGTDPALGTNPREWFTADHRSVGRRGDKVVAVSKAGDRLIVFQKRATHAIYGSGSLTWTRQELSDVIGCVGPHAVATVDERVCYFWASDGPYRTDGTQVQYIGQPIRQLAVEVDSDEIETRVGYSPDDGLVYFIVSPGGADEYSLALVFDHRRERWMKSQWIASAGVNVEFGSLEFLDSTSAPGPAGAPSTLVATATSDTTIDLTWVNGDANVDNETRIYRDTTTGFTPSDITNRIAIANTGVEAYEDTGLTPCTTYYYKVLHYRNSQASSPSAEAFDTTALAKPDTVALAGLTTGLRITGNNSANEDVEIWRSTDGSNFSLLTTLTGPGTTFSYDDTGLTVDNTYWYYAIAAGITCADSPASSTVSRTAGDATTAPAAPSGLTATAVGETQINLAWTDNSDNEDAFRVERSTDGGTVYTFLATLPAGTTSYNNTGLTSNTQYHYQVRAQNNAGNSAYTTAANDTTDPNLDTPTGLVCSNPTISTIDLDWTENAGDESGIQVWQATPLVGSTYSLVTTTAANATSYTATGLSATTPYFYKLRPVLGAVVGSYSTTDSETTIGSPPSTPGSFTATKNVGTPTTIIDLAWGNVTGEDGFLLQRKSGAGSFADIATKGVDVLSHSDTGLTPGTTYTYRVKATNATNGDSSYSTEDSDTTDGVATVPADPTSLAATGDDSDLSGVEKSAVDLTWTDNADNEDNYEIERCSGASCTTWAALVTLGSDVEAYTDSTVTDDSTANTIYRYRVRATNTTGDSAWVTSGDVTVEPRCTPSNVVAADSSFCTGPTAEAQLSVTWDEGDVTGIVTRTVERSVGGGAFSTLTTSPDTSTSHDDDTVSFGSSYRYRIKYSFGASGENTGDFTSSNSATKSPVDPACPPEL